MGLAATLTLGIVPEFRLSANLPWKRLEMALIELLRGRTEGIAIAAITGGKMLLFPMLLVCVQTEPASALVCRAERGDPFMAAGFCEFMLCPASDDVGELGSDSSSGDACVPGTRSFSLAITASIFGCSADWPISGDLIATTSSGFPTVCSAAGGAFKASMSSSEVGLAFSIAPYVGSCRS